MGEDMMGLRITNWYLQNSHGDVKYSKGNRVAKELICMAHGHEQMVCGLPGEWRCWVEGHSGKIGTTVVS